MIEQFRMSYDTLRPLKSINNEGDVHIKADDGANKHTHGKTN